ncbi:MAG: hypothetical protein ACLUUJ_00900 [Acutalibacteraceae bacterium]
MNQVQEILLSLLTHIQTVCTSMQIPCVLAGETAMEAYCRQAFRENTYKASMIVPASDMVRLAEALESQAGDTLFVESMRNNPHFPGFFLRVGNRDTLCFSRNSTESLLYPGICVEILPLRNEQPNRWKRKFHSILESGLYKRACYASAVTLKGRLVKWFANLWMIGPAQKKSRTLFARWSSFYGQDQGGKQFLRRGMQKRILFANGLLQSRVSCQLESVSFSLPARPETFLSRYNKNWKKNAAKDPALPASLVLSAHISFEEYHSFVGGSLKKHFHLLKRFNAMEKKVKDDRTQIRRAFRIVNRVNDNYALRTYCMEHLEQLQDLLQAGEILSVKKILAPYMQAKKECDNLHIPLTVSSEFDMFLADYRKVCEKN